VIVLQETIYSRAFTEEQLATLKAIIPIARKLSGYDGVLHIAAGRENEFLSFDTHAWTTWSPITLWQVPSVKVFPCLLEEGYDATGVCLTHELIHCRQGFWKVYGQKFLYTLMFWKKGEIPIEEEAYDSVNFWYDYQRHVLNV